MERFPTVTALVGKRVRLRPYELRDAPAVREACVDPDSQHWLPLLPDPYTIQVAEHWCGPGSREMFETGTGINLAVADAESDQLAGTVGFHKTDWRARSTEIGYWSSPWARGSGRLAEGVRLLCRWGFETAGLRRIMLFAGTGNLGSRRVAERCGFTLEGVQRSADTVRDGTRIDLAMYGLLPGELT